MIRINLLRQKVAAPATFAIEKSKVLSGGIVFLTISLILIGGGWWRLGLQAAAAQQEVDTLQVQAVRLAEVHKQVVQFEEQKKLLDDRISVIERLKQNQTGPVELLESIRASIPDRPTLWLTSLSQKGKKVTVEGRSLDVPSIADLISALSRSRNFKTVDLAYWQEEEPAIKFQLNCDTR
jgi:Tfp pilus assembly protein PilN